MTCTCREGNRICIGIVMVPAAVGIASNIVKHHNDSKKGTLEHDGQVYHFNCVPSSLNGRLPVFCAASHDEATKTFLSQG